MRRLLQSPTILLAALWTPALALMGVAATAMATAVDRQITVTARNHNYREAPVSVTIEMPRDFAGVALFDGAAQIPVQARMVSGKVEISFIVHDMKRGDSKTYRLAFTKSGQAAPASGVIVERVGTEDLDFRINNEVVTRYDTRTGPNKPYFYPIWGPDHKRMARRYPFETVEGESHDHPHHRGLWFTHGSVNGVDFWSEEANAGKTRHMKYEAVECGPVYGYFRAATEWLKKGGTKVAEDRRETKIYNVRDGRLIDFSVTVMATDGPLVFGDTKEGSFGIRVPDSMCMTKGDGHILMSTGVKDQAAWGKKAEWVDYSGTVEGAPMGITILDDSKNLRHPTTWHVRDYGLFAANPFGLHDFDNDKANPHKGDFTIPAGGSQTFRYRVFIHKGLGNAGQLGDVWAAYADPPEVTVK
jgi:hypothetical protein